MNKTELITLLKTYDELLLLELLEISSEEIIDAFLDKIEEKIEQNISETVEENIGGVIDDLYTMLKGEAND